MKDRINVNGHDGTFGAYIARPAASQAPAVVVLQELFGVNADIREKCDELAEQGFVAVAPDLFWRQEPGVDLGVRSEADWQHGLRLSGQASHLHAAKRGALQRRGGSARQRADKRISTSTTAVTLPARLGMGDGDHRAAS